VKSIQGTVTRNWNALQAKVAADMQNLKHTVEQQKQTIELKLAGKNAELLEREADFAIDYAIASVQPAHPTVDRLAARHDRRAASSRFTGLAVRCPRRVSACTYCPRGAQGAIVPRIYKILNVWEPDSSAPSCR
jgi:hypothetical protein